MITRTLALAALGGLVALPACTSGQSAMEPLFKPGNVSASQLQFQVGTANLNGTLGLNTVVTFRQPTGLSALLDSTPAITLPFTNTAPAAAAGNDSGTNTITGPSPQPPNGVAAPPTTFSVNVGAFAYGFLAANSSTAGADPLSFYTAGPPANRMPYYGAPRRAFYVGPGNSIVPNFKDGTFPGGCSATACGFLGYPSGFTTFALAPTTGAYSLSVGLANASSPVPTFTATTSMTSLAMLPAMPKPVITSTTDANGNATGGLNITETVPPGVTETAIFIIDLVTGNYYTVIFHGSGVQTGTLAPNLGVITAGVAGPSLTPGPLVPGPQPQVAPGTGDAYRAYAIGFDYPAMEAVPIGPNPAQAPVINNSGTACAFSGVNSMCPGQADLTQSASTSGAE